MSGAIQLTLERDGHDQPWGFRLQGGHDVGLPLSIQRVLVGTPAEGTLRKGDVILRIGNTDTKGLTHQQAADLFTNAGNQILIHLKRTGATAGHSTKNAPPIAAPQSVPIAAGIPLHGLTSISPASSPETLLSSLPKSRSATKSVTFQQASTNTHPISLTIQNQPYRTSPLIQPSAKIEIGPGSVQHLKMQAEYITGTKESQPTVDLKQAKEFEMKQKVTGTLQHLQHSPAVNQSPEPVPNFDYHPMSSQPANAPVKQFYNNPINLYSTENVAEVAKLNQMGVSGAPKIAPTSPTGLIHPNKPQKIALNPSKEYNPKESATWQALQESDPGIDPAKIQSYSSLKEHDPVFSEVYAAPKQAQFAPYHKAISPQPAHEGGPRIDNKISNVTNSHPGGRSPAARSTIPFKSPVNSPVVDFLPSSFVGKLSTEGVSDSEPDPSSVLLAALAEDDSRPKSVSSSHQTFERLPIYETNSIGGTRRIAQSSSFNKLMMDVLGE